MRPRPLRRACRGLRLAALSALLAGGLAQGLAAVELAPHRALYEISLDKARPGGKVVDARGVTTLELRRDCDGWIIVQRLSMEVSLTVGGTMRQEMEYTGWEALDGRRYSFAARTRFGDEREAFQGDAESGAPGEARFRRPRALTVRLPAGTLFPVGHMRLLIDRALAGDRLVGRLVFDGTEDKEPQTVSAFLGSLRTAGEHRYGSFGPLAERPGWTMRMAFFPADGSGPEPEFEMDMLQLDNGVAPRLVLDYHEFSVVLELQGIEALPPPDC